MLGEMARQRKWRKALPAMLEGLYPKGGGLKKLFFKFMWIMATFAAPKGPSDVVVTIEAEDKHAFKDLLSQIKFPP